MSERKRNRQAARNRRGRLDKPAPEPGSARSRSKPIYAAVALLALAAGWLWWPKPSPEPQVETSGTTRTIRFEESASGVGFVLNNGSTSDKPIPDSTLGGLALLDCDNDSLLDIFFTNGARFPGFKKADSSFHNRLYRNLGDRRFEDVTGQAGVAGHGYSMGVAVADFDNDGAADLYVAGLDRDTLYRNSGGCIFEDVTRQAGLAGPRDKPWSVAAAWLDYDRDGDLDLFVVRYLEWSWENNRVCGDPGRRLSCSPAHYAGLPNALYRNRGDGTFEDVSGASGIGTHIGKGMSAAVADYDQDGFPDIFVTNDSERNFLFRNLDGQRFEEVGVQTGIAFIADGVPVSSMGTDFRDLNGDGRPDITVTALTNETYPLFLNRGNGFVDATYPSRIGLESQTMSGWSVGAYDFDNDGDKDIFTANSHVSENIEHYRQQPYRQPNALFQAAGDGTYRNVAPDAGPALRRVAAHRGAAFGDLDNDGAVDAVVSAIGSEAEVLFNATGPGNWLVFDLQGTASNRDGLGANIRLTHQSGRVQYNHATTAVGYASSSDTRVHFGLGTDRVARQVEIRWPSGTLQTLEEVAAGQILRVVEPR